MKEKLITDVLQAMLPYLNNAQNERLQDALQTRIVQPNPDLIHPSRCL